MNMNSASFCSHEYELFMNFLNFSCIHEFFYSPSSLVLAPSSTFYILKLGPVTRDPLRGRSGGHTAGNRVFLQPGLAKLELPSRPVRLALVWAAPPPSFDSRRGRKTARCAR